MLKIDIGSGPQPQPGFDGVDMLTAPNVKYGGIDFERDRLPFEDGTVDEVFSAHCFEHVEHPANLLREILRVCRDGAKVTIWMPHGHSDDAFILGHRVFYTRLHWDHFVRHYPDDWLGPVARGRFRWERLRYNLRDADTEANLGALRVSTAWAVEHLVNIAWEFGVFFTVDKGSTAASAPGHKPVVEYGRGR